MVSEGANLEEEPETASNDLQWVIPAKAGIQAEVRTLDTRLREYDRILPSKSAAMSLHAWIETIGTFRGMIEILKCWTRRIQGTAKIT